VEPMEPSLHPDPSDTADNHQHTKSFLPSHKTLPNHSTIISATPQPEIPQSPFKASNPNLTTIVQSNISHQILALPPQLPDKKPIPYPDITHQMPLMEYSHLIHHNFLYSPSLLPSTLTSNNLIPSHIIVTSTSIMPAPTLQLAAAATVQGPTLSC